MKKKSLVGWAWVSKTEPLLKWKRDPFGLLADIPWISKAKPKIGVKVLVTIQELPTRRK